MGLFEGLMGGAGGFLQTGSPIGAAAGLIGGLFGSGSQDQSTTYQYSQLTPEQQRMVGGASAQLPALMQALGPGAQNALIQQLQGQFSGVMGQQVTDSFNLQSGRARANMARTGGGPSSIMNSQLSQLGHERGKAMNLAEMQATQMAESIGGGRFQQSLAATGQLGGLINQAEGTRRMIGQQGTATAPGSNMSAIMGGIGNALTDSGSFFNQNQGAFGAFGAPIFGSPAQPNQQQFNAGSQVAGAMSAF